MPLEFYNTLTRRQEEFIPLNPPRVGMYTCGPTVYNHAHIGNLRAFMFEDLLRRYLEYQGYAVTHVMNITDVEDKIIRAVRETGQPLREITDRYTREFFRDLDTLQIRRAHVTPRATDTIPEMIALIESLIAKQHAYVGEDGSVYYSIKSFPAYGKLARLNLDDLQSGARVKHDEYAKDAVADFALWKAWDEADGDVKWDSPWGPGRPGWHIECSVMSMKHLGPSFDLHCGGEDLVFPHHEDEIAQSEAATGKPFVRYWLHNAHLLVEGRKMSKSLGNFFTLRDLVDKGWTGREIRYVLIGAHYRDPLNFTMDGLQAARAALQRLDECLAKLRDRAGRAGSPASSEAIASRVGETTRGEGANLKSQIENALDADLNISGALGAVFDFVRETNKRLAERTIPTNEAAAILAGWEHLDQIFGFGLPAAADTVPPAVQQLVADRQAARRAKDFQRADAIRDQLAADGWTIEDTPQGPRAKRAR
ncbi:cysteine--tRNA ligase [bacterium]|nr:cysteine--tRNA ligase [bacterium]